METMLGLGDFNELVLSIRDAPPKNKTGQSEVESTFKLKKLKILIGV